MAACILPKDNEYIDPNTSTPMIMGRVAYLLVHGYTHSELDRHIDVEEVGVSQPLRVPIGIPKDSSEPANNNVKTQWQLMLDGQPFEDDVIRMSMTSEQIREANWQGISSGVSGIDSSKDYVTVISREIPSFSLPEEGEHVNITPQAAQELTKLDTKSYERQVVVQTMPGRPPYPGFLVEAATVQIIVFGPCITTGPGPTTMGETIAIQEAYDVLRNIQDVLHLICPIQWQYNVDVNIDHWNGITAQTGIIWAGYNSRMQPVWTQSFRIVIEPQQIARIMPNRDPL